MLQFLLIFFQLPKLLLVGGEQEEQLENCTQVSAVDIGFGEFRAVETQIFQVVETRFEAIQVRCDFCQTFRECRREFVDRNDHINKLRNQSIVAKIIGNIPNRL